MRRNAPVELDVEVAAASGEYAFACWQPQWGGYVGKCVVTFDRVTGSAEGEAGCFVVENWHDGEFPRNEGPPVSYHYCDAAQLIDFGVTILERQRANQKAADGAPVAMPKSLAGLRDRLIALASLVSPE